jgi:Predicted dithiol-disulfide isomerase involved in polyketide biosynthesis
MCKLIVSLIIMWYAFSVSAAENASPRFEEGVDYELIVPAQSPDSANKIEVVELFWYKCSHCYSFEPYVERWLKSKPENVELLRLPAILNPNWAVHAQAYYTAEALGVLDKIHTPLFNAIHLHNRSLNSEDELAKFFAEHGINKGEFRAAFRSFAVDSKVRRAQVMTQRYGTTGVPAMIVAGKYRTSGGMVGDYNTLLEVVNFLVAKEASGS